MPVTVSPAQTLEDLEENLTTLILPLFLLLSQAIFFDDRIVVVWRQYVLPVATV